MKTTFTSHSLRTPPTLNSSVPEKRLLPTRLTVSFGNLFKQSLRLSKAFALSASLVCLNTSLAAELPQFLNLGTASPTGVYYPMGAAVCKMVNQTARDTGLRCSVKTSAGSIDNLNSMHNGEMDLAIAQADAQQHAYNGTEDFETSGPYSGLRTIATLHTEPFTIIARADAHINTFDDLLGKRVNLGLVGSGHRETMEAVMQIKGWQADAFSSMPELSLSQSSLALCNGDIDAYVAAVGHPSGAVMQATNTCDVVIVSASNSDINGLLKHNKAYVKTTIAGGMYRGNPKNIETFGIRASLMASSNIAPDTAYILAKNIASNMAEIKTFHPAFHELSVASMATQHSPVPMHEGAMKYYKEVGLAQ